MTYKVIMWGTGACGIFGLRHIMAHPEMELVGVRVFTSSKDGKTAGEIAGIPNGHGAHVVATRDENALIAMKADAVVFMDSDRTLTDPRIPGTETYDMVGKMCRLLESGKNVVATTVVGMCHPPLFGAGVYDRINAACKKGDTTMFTTGIEPGFMGDVLPLVLSSLSQEITSIRTTQFLDYSQYHHEGTFNAYGFGKKPDDPSLANTAHSNRYMVAWEVVPHIVADGMGVKLDEVKLRTYVETTPFAFDTFVGRIEAGTIAAHRFEVIGVVDGKERIILEHVSRIHDDVAPHWESMGKGKGGFRVVLKGVPNMVVNLEMGHMPERTPMADAGIGTACRAVNAVPYVVRATPGAKTVFDLPMIVGKGALR
jgi:4-hydroxy-tetrahydrodipicolinate reductase